MKKKLTLIILMTCIICMFLAACGSKKEESTQAPLRIGSLKGPTSMGLVNLMYASENGETEGQYEFTMETQPDVIMTAMVQGDLDIALVPANVASIMYNKTQGAVSVIDINTLGVLYLVSGDSSITDMESLEGRTIYIPGKGTTPEYVLTSLLDSYSMTDKVTLEFKSEATEAAALLAQDPNAVGLLPQPFVTAATTKNADLNIVMDLNTEWDKFWGSDGGMIVTGVTVVRNDVLNERHGDVVNFMNEQQQSVNLANSDMEATAKLIVEKGIVENEAVALKAIPGCNITYIAGKQMMDAYGLYLDILYSYDPSSVGGAVPAEGFYFVEE